MIVTTHVDFTIVLVAEALRQVQMQRGVVVPLQLHATVVNRRARFQLGTRALNIAKR